MQCVCCTQGERETRRKRNYFIVASRHLHHERRICVVVSSQFVVCNRDAEVVESQHRAQKLHDDFSSPSRSSTASARKSGEVFFSVGRRSLLSLAYAHTNATLQLVNVCFIWKNLYDCVNNYAWKWKSFIRARRQPTITQSKRVERVQQRIMRKTFEKFNEHRARTEPKSPSPSSSSSAREC